MIGGLLDDVDERSSNVPGEQRGEAGVFQNVFDERSGCGFSVGASDANEAAVEKAVGKFDLAPDENVVGACGLQNCGIGGDAGARDDKILAVENLLSVAAELKGNLRSAEFRGG